MSANKIEFLCIGAISFCFLSACDNNAETSDAVATETAAQTEDKSAENQAPYEEHPSTLMTEEPDYAQFHTPWDAFERVAVDSDWFDVYRIYDDVFALYESGQWEEVISYLIVGENRALLFDTGFGIAPIRPVAQQLTNKEIFVLNSHSHYDHVGGNYEFQRITGPDNDYARNNANGVPNKQARLFVPQDSFSRPLPEGFSFDTYEIKPYTVTDIIGDGDVVDLGGIVLEVFETPGHSPDSLSLLDRDHRRLFTGDTLYPAEFYGHVEGADFEDYRQSIDRLATLEPLIDTMLTAHVLPVMEASYLSRVKTAFDEIAAGREADAVVEGVHQYNFVGFSIWLREPGKR